MEKYTHEEILERLHKIANGSAENDLETLVLQLRFFADRAEEILDNH